MRDVRPRAKAVNGPTKRENRKEWTVQTTRLGLLGGGKNAVQRVNEWSEVEEASLQTLMKSHRHGRDNSKHGRPGNLCDTDLFDVQQRPVW